MKDQIPSAPFAEWLNQRFRHYEEEQRSAGELSPAQRLCIEIGWSAENGPRQLYRYRHQILETKENGLRVTRHADTYRLETVQLALEHAGVDIEEIYPGLKPLSPAERASVRTLQAFCVECDEKVSVMADGSCAWCGTLTAGGDGPWGSCGCGCGATIALFDRNDRPVRYRRGHAPKSLEKPKPDVPIGPFHDFIQRVVEELGSKSAAATELGINRCYLNSILSGVSNRGTAKRVVKRKTVQSALRAYGSQGKGKPWKPGAPRFADLYGQFICPQCDGEKSRAAILCKACRTNAGRRGRRTHTRQVQAVPMRKGVKMTSRTLSEARRLHLEEGCSLRECARRLIHRTGYMNEKTMCMALSRQFKKRGWTVRDQGTATAFSNKKRVEDMPQCSFVKASGTQCSRRTRRPSGRCWHHEEDRIAEGIAHLRRREERELIAA